MQPRDWTATSVAAQRTLPPAEAGTFWMTLTTFNLVLVTSTLALTLDVVEYARNVAFGVVRMFYHTHTSYINHLSHTGANSHRSPVIRSVRFGANNPNCGRNRSRGSLKMPLESLVRCLLTPVFYHVPLRVIYNSNLEDMYPPNLRVEMRNVIRKRRRLKVRLEENDYSCAHWFTAYSTAKAVTHT